MTARATELAPPWTHDGGVSAPLKAEVVASWAARAFVENLTVAPSGAIFVTIPSDNRIDRYVPATKTTTVFARLPAPPMGVAVEDDGTLWVTGGPMIDGPGYIWRIGRDGDTKLWCDLPDALFMNGCALHPTRHTLLACESLTGRILEIDLDVPGRFSSWLTSDRLKPAISHYPGANGIKTKDGHAWISVSGAMLILRVTIQPDGSAGAIETAAQNLVADDFAIGASGTLYIATHPEHTVLRIAPSGERTTVAGPAEGMIGSTACAFGRAIGDETALYVTTDGGYLIPHATGIEDAKLVRLEVGERGYFHTTKGDYL